jgi:predicted nucleotidyltransferase
MKRQVVLLLLQQDKQNLKTYGVESLTLFGSVARDEANAASDIDLLVSFHKTPGLFGFLSLRKHLEDLLDNHKVDLVTKDALHHRLRDQVLRESINAF